MVLNRISGAISSAQQTASNTASNVRTTVNNAVSSGQQAASNAASNARTAVSNAVSTGQQAVSSATSNARSAAGGAVSSAQQAVSNATSNARAATGNAIGASQIGSNVNALANNAANSALNRIGLGGSNQISNNNLSAGGLSPRNATLAAGLMAAGALGVGANTVHSALHNSSGTVTRANLNSLDTQARHVADRAVSEARQLGINDNRSILNFRDNALRNFYQDRVSFALSDNSPEAANVRYQLESDPRHTERARDLGVIDSSGHIITDNYSRGSEVFSASGTNPEMHASIFSRAGLQNLAENVREQGIVRGLIDPAVSGARVHVENAQSGIESARDFISSGIETRRENREIITENVRDFVNRELEAHREVRQLTADLISGNIEEHGRFGGALKTYSDLYTGWEQIRRDTFDSPINVLGFGIDIGNSSIHYNVNNNKHFFNPENISREESRFIFTPEALRNAADRYLESDNRWDGVKAVVSGGRQDNRENMDTLNRLYETQSKLTGRDEGLLRQLSNPYFMVRPHAEYYTQRLAFELAQRDVGFANTLYENMYQRELQRQENLLKRQEFLERHPHLKAVDDFSRTMNSHIEQNAVTLLGETALALAPAGAVGWGVRGAAKAGSKAYPWLATKIPERFKHSATLAGLGTIAWDVDRRAGEGAGLIDFALGRTDEIHPNYSSNAGRETARSLPGIISSLVPSGSDMFDAANNIAAASWRMFNPNSDLLPHNRSNHDEFGSSPQRFYFKETIPPTLPTGFSNAQSSSPQRFYFKETIPPTLPTGFSNAQNNRNTEPLSLNNNPFGVHLNNNPFEVHPNNYPNNYNLRQQDHYINPFETQKNFEDEQNWR